MTTRRFLRRASVLFAVALAAGCAADGESNSSASRAATTRPVAAQPGNSGVSLTGYANVARTTELERERAAMEKVSAANCDEYLKRLTAAPHVAGTDADRRTADYVAQQFKSWGYAVDIAEYHVLLPYPKEIVVELTAPVAFVAALRETPIEADIDTSTKEAIAPFNAFSPDGDVSGPLVYANYGRREDFEELAKAGILVHGAIVIVRYGGVYRGVKTAVAAEYGAAGLLIYSDPADDGFKKGDVYPKGPWRPAGAVQRGSILAIAEYPGDPGTPGRPSTADAVHLRYGEMTSLPAIPTTCLSYEDAEPILKNLDGPTAPAEWQGGLPLSYHLGGGLARARLKVECDWRLRRIWNTVATWAGLEYPDEVLLVGNHRDAWVHGAVDPGSGTAVVMEAARVLAESARAGRGPKRTVKFATWDAEEFGIIGSTEWGEENAVELGRSAVAYLNFDAAVSGGNLGLGGSPALKRTVREVLASLPSPKGALNRLAELQNDASDFPFGSLGSGSDYAVFVNHIGIPAVDLSSGGDYGVYHSLYDTYVWMRKFGDKTFTHHRDMARLAAALISRIANATVLPYDYAAVGERIDADAMVLEKKFPELDLAEVKKLAGDIRLVGDQVNVARERALEGSLALDRALKINAAFIAAEKKLLLPGGLKTRPWYRHILHAPHRDKGYGAASLPPLEDLMDRRDRDGTQTEAGRVIDALRALRDHLDAIRLMLE